MNFVQCLHIALDILGPVDLKYITNTQIIEFSYEGQRRRFTIQVISAKNASNSNVNIPDGLSRGLSALSLDPATQLWTVNWDCTVSITSDNPLTQEVPSHKVILPFCAITSVRMT